MSVRRGVRAARRALVLVGIASIPGAGLAQDATVQPGAVATVAPRIPAPEDLPGGEVRWRIAPVDGVRVFEPLAGTIDLPHAGTIRLPIAAWIGRETPAGPLSLAVVSVSWPDGRATRHDVEVLVAPRRHPNVEIVTETVQAAPGETARITVRVGNRGNLADTIGVRADPPAEWGPATSEDRRVVLPNDSVLVAVRLLVPPGARPGEMRRVTISAGGRDSASSAVARVLVTRPRDLGGLETLPASVFLGTATGPGRDLGESLVAAVDARGRIGRETEVWLSARDANVVGTASAFRRLAGGPRLRLGLRRPGWEASVGEVTTGSEPLVGDRLWGRGGRVLWSLRRTELEGFFALPEAASGASAGHLAVGSLFLGLDAMDLGLVLSDLERPVGRTGQRATSRSAALRLEIDSHSGHRLRAEAGALRIEDAVGREAFGPAGELDWSWRGEDTSLHLLARGVPSTAAGTSTRGNILSLGANRRIAGPFSVSGNGFWTAYPALDPRAESSHRGGSAGLRFSPSPVRLEVGASLRSSDYDSPGVESDERTAWATAHLPLGPARLDLRAETGIQRSGGVEITSRTYRATIPWSGRHGWLSVGASAWTGGFGGDRIQAQAAGEIDLSPVTIGGAVHLRRFGGRVRTEGYGSLAVDVTPDLATVIGVERDHGVKEEWSVSLGLRKRFGMPLPFPRAATVSGVVFDDRDADGRRDEGEPGLPGVRLRIGSLEATTDGTGRFRFEEAPLAGGRVQVDLTSLEAGSLAPPEITVGEDGRVDVPVVRPGSIEVRVFFDRDGDGIREDGEEVPAGARVEVVDAAGKAWTEVTDTVGSARFRALAPGPYAVVVRVEASLDARPVEAGSRVEVVPGVSSVVEMPLVAARKEVRFQSDRPDAQ